MKHGQLDENGECVLSGLKPDQCAGCRGNTGEDSIPSTTWKSPVAARWGDQ